MSFQIVLDVSQELAVAEGGSLETAPLAAPLPAPHRLVLRPQGIRDLDRKSKASAR